MAAFDAFLELDGIKGETEDKSGAAPRLDPTLREAVHRLPVADAAAPTLSSTNVVARQEGEVADGIGDAFVWVGQTDAVALEVTLEPVLITSYQLGGGSADSSAFDGRLLTARDMADEQAAVAAAAETQDLLAAAASASRGRWGDYYQMTVDPVE
ncbi:hypothetical protein [Falsiroseomonas oryzae]|uniref:hypothetical protein n=1 Tax=Falsiroseomonas oryzae TaxID=2766473 RepID=UPI0022EB2349|nr:hypothetical protein [Roseomonas sp. MO-31]